MPDLPTGTVTFLFTDIEGSTRLWEQHPDTMRIALTRHDVLLRQAIEDNDGVVVKSLGDGVLATFTTAPDGVVAALTLQHAMLAEPWPEQTPIRVRAALHVGAAEYRDGDYYGNALNRAARLLAAGHGEQVLLSQVTYELVRDCPPAGAGLKSLGEHRLRDLGRPENVYQLLHPDLPSEFPPLKSLDNPDLPNNLPQQVTSFIGREKEIKAVTALLGKTRLLTLTGSGGCGKTRLALQVAAEVLENYREGVWLVELAALSDPTLVPQAVALALGLREESGKPVLQTLVDFLKGKRLLLVLDNCEHVLDACARLTDALLKHSPPVQMLASSREPLGIAGEQTYRVPSLSLPAVRQVQTVESLSQYEAVRLFIERALSVQSQFTVTNDSAPALAQLCAHLDGIPLAIELAAARVRSLCVEEINGKLDNRFRLLTGGNRTALPRQQTLRALMDWSYDLLKAQEKSLLCRLAVFAGGWTLEAAEAVGIGHDVEDWEVLDLLTSLVDKSLVAPEQEEEHTRYRLLETVRQYARDRLEERGEVEAVRERHQAFFVALAEEAEPQLVGPEQTAWMDKLEREHDNLRAALEGSNKGAALLIAGALWRFWYVRGYFSESREWLTGVLAAADAQAHTSARAKALRGAGALARSQGNLAAAQTLYKECLALYQELGDRHGIASALGNLGVVAQFQGDDAAARTLYEEALAIERELGDKQDIAWSLSHLGSVHNRGDYAAARTLYEESLTLQRELGNKRGIAYSLYNGGMIAYEQGDYAAARTLHEESLTLRRALGDKGGIAYSLEAFAALALMKGASQRAPHLWGAAEALRETIGAPLPPSERSRYDQQIKVGRAALSQDAFAAAWAEGHAMTMEQAMEYALSEPDVTTE